MDYEFFHSLTTAEARTYLERFLKVEKSAVEAMRSVAAIDGVNLDYSLVYLADAMKWMVKQVKMVRIPVPEEEPSWIRQAHPHGLAEFDDDSKATVMRAAYYLGECFARLSGMRWTTGNAEYLYKNMPVIAGFRRDEELPPLVVVDNMFARIVADGGPISKINSTIQTWLLECPEAPDK